VVASSGSFRLLIPAAYAALTRIRERYLAGASNAEAVVEAWLRAQRTITAAALIMVTVFASFALAGTLSLKQVGVGLAVAVLVDATIVRAHPRASGHGTGASLRPLGHLPGMPREESV